MNDEKKQGSIEIFTHNVAWLRKHFGISKKRMAKLLEISVESLTKLEQGNLPPRLTINIFFTIQKHFHIRPSDQLGKWLDDQVI